MNFIPLVIQLLALVCLVFAAFSLFGAPPARPNWGWLGMLLWLFSLMISAVELHAAR